MRILENIPLAPLTTLRVGGPARYFAAAQTLDEVRQALEHSRQRGLPLFVLGGGSNLVIADRGWPGLVLKVSISGVDEAESDAGSARLFQAGAGEDWDGFVSRAVARDCAGIECLSGIPGTVGGTPIQNVGAYGQEVSQTIHNVLVMDLASGELKELCAEACGFEYRASIFNTTLRGRYVVLRVTFALTPGGGPHLEYADLQRHFAGRPHPSLAEVREAVRLIRLSKAMLIVEGDEDSQSAGSFFKNPIVSEETYADLARLAAGRGLPKPPRFSTPQGVKVPAAWLVERSGFPKGYIRGAVGISRRHALAIVNRGGATAAEVVALKNEVQQRVLDQWNIRLVPEPVLVGFDQEEAAPRPPA